MMPMRDLLFYLVDKLPRRILSAKSKGETECKCNCHNNSRKQGLNKGCRNSKLEKRHQDRKNPDRPTRNRSEEMRMSKSCRHCPTRDNPLHRLGDHNRHQKDEHRDNHLRQVEEYHLLEKDIHLRESQDIKLCNKEHYDHKPFHKPAD